MTTLIKKESWDDKVYTCHRTYEKFMRHISQNIEKNYDSQMTDMQMESRTEVMEMRFNFVG